MPDVSGPFDSAAFLQAPWYRDRGHLEPSGVAGPPSATAAGGELGLTAAGFDLSLALGRAHVRGAYYERTGTAWTHTVPANTSTVGPRNDLIVLRRDLTGKTVTPQRLQGTAAATPTDPAVTQDDEGVWELPLFRVQAPANSGTPLVVTDLRAYVPQLRDHPTHGVQRWTGARWSAPARIGPRLDAAWSEPAGQFGATPAHLTTLAIPDPGRPYMVQVLATCEMASVSAGTRWDLHLRGAGGGLPNADLDHNVSASETATWHRLVTPVMVDRVLVGDSTLVLEARRAYGTANGQITAYQRKFRAVIWPAFG